MKVKQFDLLRHGQPELSGVYLGRTDCILSSIGETSSDLALIENPGWEVIVCSPLKRCLLSAEKAAQKLGLELVVLDDLQEFNFGDWDGRLFEDVYAADPDQADQFWVDPVRYPPPGGETIKQFETRVARAREKILHRDESRVLIITHGGVIRCLIAQLLSVDPANWGRIKVDYSHFSQLRFEYNKGQCWPQLISSNIASVV